MRIKTNVGQLIARLQDYKRREREAFAKMQARYPELEELYRRKVIVGLERELERVRSGRGLPPSYGRWSGNRRMEGVIVRVGAMPPAKPHRPQFRAIDQRIAELRLCSTADLVIDPSSKDWVGIIRATEP